MFLLNIKYLLLLYLANLDPPRKKPKNLTVLIIVIFSCFYFNPKEDIAHHQ